MTGLFTDGAAGRLFKVIRENFHCSTKAAICIAISAFAVFIVWITYSNAELRKRLADSDAYGKLRTSQLSQERTAASVPAEAYIYDLDAVLAKINISSLETARSELIGYIWKGIDLSKLRPTGSRSGSERNVFDGIAPGAVVTSFDYSFGNGINEFIEVAQHSNGATCLLVWAQGHEGSAASPPMDGGLRLLRNAWERGCDLIVVPMALRGRGKVTIKTQKYGDVWIGGNHDGLQLLETEIFSAFRAFLEPLYATLNQVLEKRTYDRIAMAGVSGGGWMSTIYPAIDQRITYAVAVAGSFPMYLRFLPTERSYRDMADWESRYGPVYQITSYFDLYLLSGLGGGRKQTLVYNLWDPCCFAGARAMTFLPKLKLKADALGVSLDYMIDGHHYEHDISEQTAASVLDGFLDLQTSSIPKNGETRD